MTQRIDIRGVYPGVELEEGSKVYVVEEVRWSPAENGNPPGIYITAFTKPPKQEPKP